MLGLQACTAQLQLYPHLPTCLGAEAQVARPQWAVAAGTSKEPGTRRKQSCGECPCLAGEGCGWRAGRTGPWT